MKKLLLTLILGMFLISLVSAVSIGTYRQTEDVRLYQTCNNCTYCNFTSIKYPNSTEILTDIEATKRGTYYYYDFKGANTTVLGTYTYCYVCGNLIDSETGCLDFTITPSGQGGTENIVFFLFLIIMIYGITFTGLFGRNIPITILGGMAMLFLGVYIVQAGLIIYRDTLTNYFSYLTIGIGAISAFWAIFEQFDVI